MLDAFVQIAPPPGVRPSQTRDVSPFESDFSGFAFKIQANMDPEHRDRIAFFRICSGKFTKGMKVKHHRLGKEIRLSNATIFMAQERSHVEEAYPGDIIGIHNHGTIKIGDTFTTKEPLKFLGIPSFAPGAFPAGPVERSVENQIPEQRIDPAGGRRYHPGVPAASGEHARDRGRGCFAV